MAVTHHRYAFTRLLPLRQRGDEEEDRTGDEQTGDKQHREREQRLVHGLTSTKPVTRHAAYPSTLLRGSLDMYLNNQHVASINKKVVVAEFLARCGQNCALD